MADLVVRGIWWWHSGQVCFSWGALPGIFGLPPEPQCFGPPEGGLHLDLLFLVAVDTFQHCFLGLQSLCFGFSFRRGRGFLLRLRRHLHEKAPSSVFKKAFQVALGKAAACQSETWEKQVDPGLGGSSGRGNGNPLQCSCLESPHGQRSLVGYGPQGHKELDMTKAT